MVVCWGGHSTSEGKYLYARHAGTQLGLCKLNICIGRSLGVMEALMKGAAVDCA